MRHLLLLLLLLAAAPAAVAQDPDPGPAAGTGAQVLPGDQIAIRILREPELSGTFAVTQSGEAVLPRLGVVHVAGRSAGMLQDSLRLAFGRYLRDPSIEVSVLRRVAVLGEVLKPGLYWVDLTMGLPDVLAQAGGITEAANPKGIVVIRGGERIALSPDDQVLFAAAELRSGDQVNVGRRSWMARNPNAAIGTAMGVVTFFIGIVQLLDRN